MEKKVGVTKFWLIALLLPCVVMGIMMINNTNSQATKSHVVHAMSLSEVNESDCYVQYDGLVYYYDEYGASLCGCIEGEGAPVNATIRTYVEVGGQTYYLSESIYVASYPFYECDTLVSITIPSYFTGLNGDGTLVYGCENLTTITIEADSFDTESSGLWWDCPNLEYITCPIDMRLARVDFYDGYDPTCKAVWEDDVSGLLYVSANDNDYWGCVGPADASNLRSSYVINSSTKRIIESAFNENEWDYSSIQSVELPDGLERIEYGAFSGLSGVASLVIPDSITYFDSIGDMNGLKYINLGGGEYELGNSFFSGLSNLIEIYGGDYISGAANLPADFYQLYWDGTFEEGESGPEVYTTYEGGSYHFIRADKAEDVFELIITSDEDMTYGAGWYTAGDDTVRKYTVVGSVYGELPRAYDGSTINFYANGNLITENTVVAMGEVSDVAPGSPGEPGGGDPATGVAVNVILPSVLAITSLVALCYVLTNKKKHA